MHYTHSQVFKLIPTHCTVCNRPLVDGTSIEHGMGRFAVSNTATKMPTIWMTPRRSSQS